MLESLPNRPLTGAEVDRLIERVPYRHFVPAYWSFGEASPYGDAGDAVECIVVVSDSWFGALRLGADGWEIAFREECGLDEDPELLHMVALEELGLTGLEHP